MESGKSRIANHKSLATRLNNFMTRWGWVLIGVLLAPPPQEPPKADAWGDSLPEGAIARLGSARFQHASQVDDLQYSGDGRKIFSSGWGSIRVWDASNGRQLLKILGSQ